MTTKGWSLQRHVTARAAMLLVIAVLVVGLRFWTPAGSVVGSVEDPEMVQRLVPQSPEQDEYTVLLPLVMRRFTSAQPAPSMFGVQMYGRLTETGQHLSLAREARVSWIRLPAPWRLVEPTEGAGYDWSIIDRDVQSAVASGQRLIMIVAEIPPWAGTYLQGPVHPEKLANFAAFVHELAERYDGDGVRDAPGSPVVDHFEFFNEPDSTSLYAAEQGYDSPYGEHGDDYATLLCTVYPAIKQANSSARVLLGGIAFDYLTTEGGKFSPTFLDDVLSAGGGNCFDVMNFHYYPGFAPKWYPHGNGVIGKANVIRGILAQHGHGNKPMVVTEAGWYSVDPGRGGLPGSPEIQSRYVVQLFTQAAAARLQSMIWWNWKETGFPYEGFGLLDADNVPKPAFSAYGVAAERIGQAGFERILDVPQGAEGYRFSGSNGYPFYVLWTNDNQTRSISLPASRARVVNMYGNTLSLLADAADGRVDGRVTAVYGANPVYVEVLP